MNYNTKAAATTTKTTKRTNVSVGQDNISHRQKLA
jgi:hypothetical protein